MNVQKHNTMAILKHIPKKESVVDFRSEDGGYFIASCEVCGREYYPKKSSSKYCSSNCSISAYRTRIKEGTTVPKARISNTVKIIGNIVECGSRTRCSLYFKQFKAKLKSYEVMTNVAIGESCMFMNHKILRTSENKYEVLR